LFIEHLKLLEIVLRWMVLVKGEPCFILIILIVVVGKFVDVYQICIRLHTIVCIRPSVITVVGGTLNRWTSSHVAQYLQRRSVAREVEQVEAERVEAERVEAERVEVERVEAERVEAERVEAERVEAERVEAERRSMTVRPRQGIKGGYDNVTRIWRLNDNAGCKRGDKKRRARFLFVLLQTARKEPLVLRWQDDVRLG
jgi:hypothetical protein